MRSTKEALFFALSRVYFFVSKIIFTLLNVFSPRIFVAPTSKNLLLLSARKAAAAIRAREITSAALIEAYIERILEVNPIVNGIAEENFEEARRLAAEADALIANSSTDELMTLGITRPLHGIPFTVKDAFAVLGKRQTSGVYMRKDTVADSDAEVVRRMKEAGAICLATTNVPELCAAGETVNALYGKTSNPYDTRRSAAGSSGGEGAVIGAAASLIGVGSDIMGSVRAPAAACGIYGLLPSPQTTPMKGHFPQPIEQRLNLCQAGPLCRFSEDLPLMIRVMTGANTELDEPISSLRIFYMEGIDSPLNEYTSETVERAVKKAVAFLERKYSTTAVEVKFPLAAWTQEMFAADFLIPGQPPMTKALAAQPFNVFLELLRGLFFHSSVHSPPTMMKCLLQKAAGMDEKKRVEPLQRLEYLQRQMAELLGKDGVLLSPTMPDVAFFHNKNVFAPLNNSYAALFNVLHIPSLHCPLGLDSSSQLPVGVQVSGPVNSDGRLISIAHDLEVEFGGWQQQRVVYSS